MTTTKQRTAAQTDAIETCRKELVEARALLSSWEGRRTARGSELATAQQDAGEKVLADPDGSTKVSNQIRDLRDHIDVTDHAIAAQQVRVANAERAYLSAEGDKLETLIPEARDACDRHQARTAELLAVLEDHDGRRYTPGLGSTLYNLEQTVEQAKVRLQIVRDLAEGRDPSEWLLPRRSANDGSVAGLQIPDLYPSFVWGPEALVPAPAFLGVRHQARAVLEELSSVPEELSHELAAVQARLASPATMAVASRRAFEARARRIQARLEDLPAQIESAELEVAKVAG